MHSSIIASLLAVILCQAAACKTSPSETKAAAGSAQSADPAAERRDQINGKINHYIACLNNLDPVVFNSRETYFAWADPNKGPAKGQQPRFDDVIRESTYGYECFKKEGGLEAALGAPKVDDLDQAGAAYKKAIEQMFAAVNPAATYYAHGGYKDDGFAKAQAMHPELVAAYASFDQARHALHGVIQTHQDQMFVDEQRELEKSDGKKARWLHRELMHQAELTIRAVTAGERPEAAAVKRATAALVKAIEAARTWTTANKAEADKNVSWNSFLSINVDGFVIQLEELDRGLAAGKLPEGGSKGSVHSVIEAYNNLVNNSNTLWDH